MKIASVIIDERVHKEEDLAVMTIHDKPEWCSVSDYESLMHAQCRQPLWPPKTLLPGEQYSSNHSQYFSSSLLIIGTSLSSTNNNHIFLL